MSCSGREEEMEAIGRTDPERVTMNEADDDDAGDVRDRNECET